MLKKGFLVLLCAAMLLLGACSFPIEQTPYESLPSTATTFVGDGGSTSTVAQTNSTENAVSKGTTAKNTTAGKCTTTGKTSSTQVTNNQISWEDLSGATKSSTTVKTGSQTNAAATTTKTTQTTTTAVPTTQTTKREQVEGVTLPAEGYSPDGNIQVGVVSLSGKTVSIEIKNITTRYETEQTSHFEYVCYDKDGKELKRDVLLFGRIHKQQSRVCQITIPDGTRKVELTNLVVEYWTDGYV